MLYDLNKNIDRERATKRWETLLEEKTVIELTKKEKRSLRQNGYLHLCLGWFGLEKGYTMEETKVLYKNLNSAIYAYDKKGQRFLRKSSDLNTEEMTRSIEKFRNWSSVEGGLYLPEPHEKDFLQEIHIEMSKSKHL